MFQLSDLPAVDFVVPTKITLHVATISRLILVDFAVPSSIGAVRSAQPSLLVGGDGIDVPGLHSGTIIVREAVADRLALSNGKFSVEKDPWEQLTCNRIGGCFASQRTWRVKSSASGLVIDRNHRHLEKRCRA